MNLDKKKGIAAAALKAGRNRIVFDKERLNDIKEAITKQDMRDLFKDGAISIRQVKGRHKIKKGKRRHSGRIRKKLKEGKRAYVLKVRKLRGYLKMLKARNEITRKQYQRLRGYVKAGMFRDIKQIILFMRENEL